MNPFSGSVPSLNPAANHENPSMSNTSQIDVFSDQLENESPMFWEKVVPEAMYATLEPGDLLYIPPGWWHAFRSEEVSFSVSMWF
jgi:lysine-specific demethylase 8